MGMWIVHLGNEPWLFIRKFLMKPGQPHFYTLTVGSKCSMEQQLVVEVRQKRRYICLPPLLARGVTKVKLSFPLLHCHFYSLSCPYPTMWFCFLLEKYKNSFSLRENTECCLNGRQKEIPQKGQAKIKSVFQDAKQDSLGRCCQPQKNPNIPLHS